MKKALLILFLFVVGCGPEQPMAYNVGDTVILKANNRTAVITNAELGISSVRYSDSIGELHWERIYEYEIKQLAAEE